MWFANDMGAKPSLAIWAPVEWAPELELHLVPRTWQMVKDAAQCWRNGLACIALSPEASSTRKVSGREARPVRALLQ